MFLVPPPAFPVNAKLTFIFVTVLNLALTDTSLWAAVNPAALVGLGVLPPFFVEENVGHPFFLCFNLVVLSYNFAFASRFFEQLFCLLKLGFVGLCVPVQLFRLFVRIF